MRPIVATAGWSIARGCAHRFPTDGTGLERYAALFGGVEINSSFHEPHRAATWARWAASVPDAFRFSVKMPKTITHGAKLQDCAELVGAFLEQIAPLGDKLAVLLVQLPPKLAFAPEVAGAFFASLRAQTPVPVACEPRHPDWFSAKADNLLRAHGVARVAADPALSDVAATSGGWPGLAYWRLHGSPLIYRSAYGPERLAGYAERIEASDAGARWCVFDNTASSAATGDAIWLRDRLAPQPTE